VWCKSILCVGRAINDVRRLHTRKINENHFGSDLDTLRLCGAYTYFVWCETVGAPLLSCFLLCVCVLYLLYHCMCRPRVFCRPATGILQTKNLHALAATVGILQTANLQTSRGLYQIIKKVSLSIYV